MANLITHLGGLTLAHPVMPAAGPPVRDGKALLACAAGGAAALVTKTISVKAAEVPSPNMADFKTYFLNTELWSELPPEQWLEKEYAITRQANLPVIISLGYSTEDIAKLAPQVAPFADALELSTHYISNDPGPMQDAIRAAKTTGLPVWVKMSPFREPQALALAAQEAGADGIVAVNSFGPAFGVDIEHGGRLWMGGKGYGWMSGPALKPIALRMVYDIARTVEIPILGVGGINTGADVVEFLMVGASAVQVCTAAITNGPQIYGKIATQLGKWLDEHGYASVEEIRGLALRQPIPGMTRSPQLRVDRCIGCNRCVISCVYEALYLVEKKIRIYEERCARCGLCISRCPVDALLPNG
ncbi:MAG: NAD-dependent dihydropyrimidine dehydrogenase subunit PreA [Chloroflexi bacterium ADurb.Bin360]|nr:MAG: NAD-dependent dihydropyrimidine dehydrogenase subunit PreA [Chloroflexi bacterium ADurb.Bin360]